MSTPLRFTPISPPALPSFARPSYEHNPRVDSPRSKHSQTNDVASSPGFSLNLETAGTQTSPSAAEDIGGLPGLLIDQVRGVQSMQSGADAMVNTMLTGGDVNEAEVLTSVQKADLAFRMLLQIRNKLMDAYREVQQIQI